eukprot:TRINITY_DN16209_c0_g2_i1.p1 TRINITY_DN16209_c0_g2~~TRINITY_DN16209_c0_g2_i1.p1  ORF type:complete len:575 (+),score=127.10 TRINITY_DN16209_c0_g2_i1:113-1726(+)
MAAEPGAAAGAPPEQRPPAEQPSSPWRRGLGDEHNVATDYMTDTKREMDIIMEYVDDIHSQNIRAPDSVESMYSDTKRIIAMRAGEEVFDQIDSNKDGSLSCEEVRIWVKQHPELRHRMASVKAESLERDWTSLLDMLDSDHSQNISCDEFASFWTRSGLGTEQDAHALFRAIDASGDESLQTREVKLFLKEHPDLRSKLAAQRAATLEREWAAFFAMVEDGTDGAMDKAQFASLWAASGLGLNIGAAKGCPPPVKAPPAGEQATWAEKAPLPPQPPQASAANGGSKSPLAQQRRPQTGRPQGSSRGRLTRGSMYEGDRQHVALERPVTARRVDYAGLLKAQRDDLAKRESEMKQYHDMLRKVEEYQRRAVRLLEATYSKLESAGVDSPAARNGPSHARALPSAPQQPTPPQQPQPQCQRPSPQAAQAGATAPAEADPALPAPPQVPVPPPARSDGDADAPPRAHAPRWDGDWVGKDVAASISGSRLQWVGGSDQDVQQDGDSLVMELEGATYTAQLSPRGRHLTWSDGDVWTKVSA